MKPEGEKGKAAVGRICRKVDRRGRRRCGLRLRVLYSDLSLSLQAPLEIILELCRDLRRDKDAARHRSAAQDDPDDVVVHMDSAKILVISHDISFLWSTEALGWRRGVVVSGVRRMNEVNAHRARLVPGWVIVFGRVYHLGM